MRGGNDDVYTILKAAQSHTLCVSPGKIQKYTCNYGVMHDSERAVCGGDT